MYFEHELLPQSSGTEVLHRIIFKGMLGPVFGKLIGNKLKKEQSRTMRALKKKLRIKNSSVINIFLNLTMFCGPNKANSADAKSRAAD